MKVRHGHLKVLEALRTAGPQGMTVAELVTHFGLTKRIIRRYIGWLRASGQIESMPVPRARGGTGRYPNVWYARGYR